MTRDHWISTALLTLWTLGAIWWRWGAWAEVLSVVYAAGLLWANGLPELIYATTPQFFGANNEVWQDVLVAQGLQDHAFFAYVYPPIWAALVAPLTQILSAQAFFGVFALIQFPLLATTAALAGRLLKPDHMSWTTWSLWSVTVLSVSAPAIASIWHVQPGITVSFLTVLAIERCVNRAPILAGCALALAAAIKLSPAVFVAIFLWRRDWPAVISFFCAGAGLALASVWLTGWPLHVEYLSALKLASQGSLISHVNISVLAALDGLIAMSRLASPVAEMSATAIAPQSVSWLPALLTLAPLCFVVLFAQRTAQDRSPKQAGLALLGGLIAVNLFGPLGWNHYYVLPLLMMIGAVHVTFPLHSTAVFVLLLISMSMPWVALASQSFSKGLTYVIVMCGIWVGLLVQLLRQKPQ